LNNDAFVDISCKLRNALKSLEIPENFWLDLYEFFTFNQFAHLSAEKPPKSAPLAIPTQNPIVKPKIIKVKLN
jgi:hypothetical protein